MKLQALTAVIVFSVCLTGPVFSQGPAVSAVNGKIEFDAGALDVPQSFVSRAAGTLTLPLGDQFGLQLDGSIAQMNGLTGATALHLFTRDPQSYLIGGTLGLITTPGASIVAAGPEAELYLGRWTLEAWAGAGYAHPASGPNRLSPFLMSDLAYYPTDNTRLSFGLSLLDGFAALHASGEYLLTSGPLPLALTGDARLGSDGSLLATVGLRAYLGGTDKPLIARHRQDDPWDRGESLVSAVGGASVVSTGSGSGGSTGGSGDSSGSGPNYCSGAAITPGCIPLPTD